MSKTKVLREIFERIVVSNKETDFDVNPHLFLGESKMQVLGISPLHRVGSEQIVERDKPLSSTSSSSAPKDNGKSDEQHQAEMDSWLKRNQEFMGSQTPDEQKAIKSWKSNRYKQKAFGITGQLKPGTPYNKEWAVRHQQRVMVKSPDQKSLQTSKIKVLNMIKVTKKRAASGRWKVNFKKSIDKRHALGLKAGSGTRKYNPKKLLNNKSFQNQKFYDKRKELIQAHGGEEGAKKHVDDLIAKDNLNVRAYNAGKEGAEKFFHSTLTDDQHKELGGLRGLSKAKKIRQFKQAAHPDVLDKMDKMVGGDGYKETSNSKDSDKKTTSNNTSISKRKSSIANVQLEESYYKLPSQKKLNEALENDEEYATYEQLFQTYFPDFDVTYVDTDAGATFTLTDDDGDVVLTLVVLENENDEDDLEEETDTVTVFVGDGYEYLESVVQSYEGDEGVFPSEDLEDFLDEASQLYYDTEDEEDDEVEDDDGENVLQQDGMGNFVTVETPSSLAKTESGFYGD